MDGVQSIFLVMRIIECLAESSDAIGVTELASRLGTTKSRIFRYLRTLVDAGYIAQSPSTDRYRIGPRLTELGRNLAPGRDLTAVAEATLRQLRDTIGHSCVIGRVDERGVKIAMTVAGRAPIEIGVRQGSVLSLHASAQGKVVLAYCNDDFRERALSGDLEALTSHTVTDPAELREQLSIIRARGWATAPDEIAIGLNTLAYPIFDAGGSIVGTIAAVSLTHFIPPRPSPELHASMRSAAAKISSDLGYAGDQYEVA